MQAPPELFVTQASLISAAEHAPFDLHPPSFLVIHPATKSLHYLFVVYVVGAAAQFLSTQALAEFQ